MNKLTILCILVTYCIIAAAQQSRRDYVWPPRRPFWHFRRWDYDWRFPWQQRPFWHPRPPRRHCRDHRGRRIPPGQSYYDGCNTCQCRENGLSMCTQRFCGPYTALPPPSTTPSPW